MDIEQYAEAFLTDKGISQKYQLIFPGNPVMLKNMLAEFYTFARQKHTDHVLTSMGAILATSEDVQLLIDSIENPPEPGEGLRKAKATYEEMLANHTIEIVPGKDEELDRARDMARRIVNRLPMEDLRDIIGKHWRSKEISWERIIKLGYLIERDEGVD